MTANRSAVLICFAAVAAGSVFSSEAKEALPTTSVITAGYNPIDSMTSNSIDGCLADLDETTTGTTVEAPATSNLVPKFAALRKDAWMDRTTLVVDFIGGTPSTRQQVLDWANEWSPFCNRKFVLFNGAIPPNVRVSFWHPGFQAKVGRAGQAIVNSGHASVFLGGLERKSTPLARAIVLHEFGHVLGMQHEQLNPSKNWKWDKKAVYKWHEERGWGRAKVDKNFFEVIKWGYDQVVSTWDSKSIMQYPMHKSFTSNNVEVPYNLDLSSTDKAYMKQLYQVR